MTDFPSSEQPTADEWGICPPGQLHSLVDRLQIRHRRAEQMRQVRRIGTGAVVALLLAVGVTQWSLSDATPVRKISCQECVAQFDAYQAHLVGQQEMAPPQPAEMAAHLEYCPFCKAKFEQMFPGLLSELLRDAGRQIALPGEHPFASPKLAWHALLALAP